MAIFLPFHFLYESIFSKSGLRAFHILNPGYVSEQILTRENRLFFLMIPNRDRCYYLVEKRFIIWHGVYRGKDFIKKFSKNL